MNRPRWHRAACLVALAATSAAWRCAQAAEPPLMYDVVVETGMPHLEENLRYAVTRERRCVDTGDLGQMFPVLTHVALQDCYLARTTQQADQAIYALVCSSGHGTTGEAHWQFADGSITGTLNVKLGGKNMTFYQRVSGRSVGACSAP